jgi:hypothetical protein
MKLKEISLSFDLGIQPDRFATLLSTSSSADSVNVVFKLTREIVIDDTSNVVNIYEAF